MNIRRLLSASVDDLLVELAVRPARSRLLTEIQARSGDPQCPSHHRRCVSLLHKNPGLLRYVSALHPFWTICPLSSGGSVYSGFLPIKRLLIGGSDSTYLVSPVLEGSTASLFLGISAPCYPSSILCACALFSEVSFGFFFSRASL